MRLFEDNIINAIHNDTLGTRLNEKISAIYWIISYYNSAVSNLHKAYIIKGLCILDTRLKGKI